MRVFPSSKIAARAAAALAVSVLATGIEVAGSVAATAADLGPYYGQPVSYPTADEPLEFGTGWYLRGDAAYSDEDHPALNTARRAFDRDATASGYGFGIGAGYKFNNWLRADVTGDFLDPFDYKAAETCRSGCSYRATATVWRWDALANGYVDLGTWFGVTPYIGAGAGVGGTRAEGSFAQTIVPGGRSISQNVPTRSDAEFAWAAMAGFSYAMSSHLLLDVGYRYLDLGKTAVSLYPVSSTQKDLAAHQVRVGLRYNID